MSDLQASSDSAFVRGANNDGVKTEKDVRESALKSAQERVGKADKLMDAGNFLAADALLVQVEQAGQLLFAAKIKRANIAINTGRLDDAAELIDQAEEIEPGNKWTAFNRAMLAEISGDTKKAQNEIEAAIFKDPDNQPFRNMHRRLAKRALIESIEPGSYVTVKRPAVQDTAPPIKILCWDLSHNPAGRAMALADVASEFAAPEIAGPILGKDASAVWQPLKDDPKSATTSSWLAGEPAHFFAGAIRYVQENPCDSVWVSKARFPSLFIGCLYKLIHNAAMVVDLDDDDLAFVQEDDPVDVQEFLDRDFEVNWTDLAAPMWGQLAVSMMEWADAVTSCNEVLQGKHGGEIVRHARRADAFAQDGIDRQEIRKRLGFSDQDKVILFMGTPRRHKGILEIARAVINLRDPDAALLVVGTFTETDLEKQLKSMKGLRLVHLEDQPLSVAAEINFAADLSTAFQDTESRIALTQTPAKLSDAAAMGRLSVTSNVAPVDIFVQNETAIAPKDGEVLAATLRRGLTLAADASTAPRIRQFFENTISTAANAPAARRAFDHAATHKRDLPADFERLLAQIAKRVPIWDSATTRAFFERYTKVEQPRIKVTSPDQDLDIVFFWKQNDTGIYGRRQDWVHRTLADLPNVRKILHIDAPISADRLNSFQTSNANNAEDRLVARNTVSRFLHAADQTDVHYRSFVHAGRTTSFLGRKLDPKAMFPVRVAQWMEELDIGQNAMAWVCPVVSDFDKVQEMVGFEHIVADVIDNQNLWPMRPETRRSVVKSYNHIFENSKVTFSNCEPVADWLRKSGQAPRVISNGLYFPSRTLKPKTPSLLRSITGPVVGYVGNMSDRIDWELLNDLAELRPDWTYKMIGKLPRVQTEEFLHFQKRPNVLMPGVVPADQMSAYYFSMSAGLIPHLDSHLSRAMNPLKLYVYRAHGLRVVSTPIYNIDDFGDDIVVARSAAEMALALDGIVEDARQNGPSWPADETLNRLSWKTKVDQMMSHVQQICFPDQIA